MSGGGRVMVVDDDAEIRVTLCEILADTGLETVCAENGREALEHLRDGSETPCVILLDLMMPVMNGRQFLEERRRDDVLSKVPTIVITAGDAQRLPEHVPVMRKPVALDALLDAVGKHCGCR